MCRAWMSDLRMPLAVRVFLVVIMFFFLRFWLYYRTPSATHGRLFGFFAFFRFFFSLVVRHIIDKRNVCNKRYHQHNAYR